MCGSGRIHASQNDIGVSRELQRALRPERWRWSSGVEACRRSIRALNSVRHRQAQLNPSKWPLSIRSPMGEGARRGLASGGPSRVARRPTRALGLVEKPVSRGIEPAADGGGVIGPDVGELSRGAPPGTMGYQKSKGISTSNIGDLSEDGSIPY